MKLQLLAMFAFLAFASQAQSVYFPPLSGNTWETTSPASLNWCEHKIDSLYQYLETNNTRAFILLKNGRIVLEKYFGNHTANTPWQWASAGKTLTAFMVGIAQQENYLNILDSSSRYLGQGWTSCSPEQEGKINIKQQLTMTTGLEDNVADPFCTLDTCLIYKAEAGTRWAYHNGPYTLLDRVVAAATGQSLNQYTNLKLKNPTGMTGSFLTVGYNNVYYSTARSMARFGLLILNKGNWNGNQIMTDTNYFNQMINTSQNLNKSYGYLWWLNGKESYMVPGSQFVFNGFMNPNAPADAVAAMGKDGQFLNVVPGQNLVWMRMGNAPDGLPVPFLMNDKIWEYLNALPCAPTSAEAPKSDNWQLNWSYQAEDQKIVFQSNLAIKAVDWYSIQGRKVRRTDVEFGTYSLPLQGIPPGIYMGKVYSEEGKIQHIKLLKI